MAAENGKQKTDAKGPGKTKVIMDKENKWNNIKDNKDNTIKIVI